MRETSPNPTLDLGMLCTGWVVGLDLEMEKEQVGGAGAQEVPGLGKAKGVLEEW